MAGLLLFICLLLGFLVAATGCLICYQNIYEFRKFIEVKISPGGYTDIAATFDSRFLNRYFCSRAFLVEILKSRTIFNVKVLTGNRHAKLKVLDLLDKLGNRAERNVQRVCIMCAREIRTRVVQNTCCQSVPILLIKVVAFLLIVSNDVMFLRVSTYNHQQDHANFILYYCVSCV